MLTLWALVIGLAVRAAAVDLLSLPSALPNLSGRRSILQSGQLLRYPPIAGSSSFRQRPPVTPPGANHWMSGSKLEDYLNRTLPPQIEEMLKCAEVDLAGLLGMVLETVSNLDLQSLLDIASPLNILGGGGQSGPQDKGTSSESSSLPLPSLSKATDAVSNLLPLAQGLLGSLTPNGARRDPARKAGSSLLSNLPLSGVLNQVSEPLSGVLNTVGELTESTEGILKNVVPGGVTDALSGLLGNINLKDLLLGLEVQKATVEDMMSAMTDDEILIQASATAFVGGKGLVGPVISLLGFQVNGDVTLKIGISINSTQCVNLKVQDKDIKVNKVYLQLVKTVTDTLPLPVPVPLDDVISQVLTVKLQENLKEAKSCDIDLRDFTECKNCEYRHPTSQGLPRPVQGAGQPSLGIPLGDRQKRMGCELQAPNKLLSALREENVAVYLLLQITVTHYPGCNRTKSPSLVVPVVDSQAQMVCKVHACMQPEQGAPPSTSRRQRQ